MLKFSVPMVNGVADYNAPILGVWQTQEQRNKEIDPVQGTIQPVM